jgi:hypothetical protein
MELHMNSHQQRTDQMFRRVLGWFSANLALLNQTYSAGVPALSAQVDALTGIVERVSGHATQQQTQYAQSLLIARDERAQRGLLLTQHMGTIAKVARALVGKIPGIGILAMPSGNIASTSLVTAAGVMARKAEIYKTVLIEHGLPADFVEQLDAIAASLKSCVDARGEARAARAGATRGLESELALGHKVVAIMDATLIRALANNPAKMQEWRHVKRVTLSSVPARPALSAGQETSGVIQPTSEVIQPRSDAIQPTSPAVQVTSSEVQPGLAEVQKAA